jgi:hypothetical protein
MKNDNFEKFKIKVLKRFSKEITDQVFLMIENDRGLFQEYLRLVSELTLDTVNQTIGRFVKERYKLKNAAREYKPKSKLIKSHQEY